jgi:hypothetical protein
MDEEGRLTIDQLADRWRPVAEGLDDLRTADPVAAELGRLEFLERMDRELATRPSSRDQTGSELRDLEARIAEIRKLLGHEGG